MSGTLGKASAQSARRIVVPPASGPPLVGGRPVSDAASDGAVGFDPSGAPVVALPDSVPQAFDGTAWQDVMVGAQGFASFAYDPSGTLWQLAVGSSGAQVARDGVANQLPLAGSTPVSASLAIDAAGVVMVAVNTFPPGTQVLASTGGAFSTVATPWDASDVDGGVAPALAASGQAFLLATLHQGKPVGRLYESGAWTMLPALSGTLFPSDQRWGVADLAAALDPSGNPAITWIDGGDGLVHVMRFAQGAWADVAPPIAASKGGIALSVRLRFDAGGNALVALHEASDLLLAGWSGIRVLRSSGSSWQALAAPAPIDAKAAVGSMSFETSASGAALVGFSEDEHFYVRQLP